jgi:cell division protein FtsL
MNIKKLVVPVLGLLLVATILTAVKASAQGGNLVALENEAASLKEQNKDLEDKIVAAGSLTQIDKKAAAMGMKTPEKFIYLTQQGLALR